MPFPAFRPNTLDTLDRQILNILQVDATISMAALAEQLHTSMATCQRRINRLQESDVLLRRVAIVEPVSVGYQLSVFISVMLDKKTGQRPDDFICHVAQETDVVQIHEIAGQFDFLLLAHVRDMPSYHRLVRRLLTPENNVRSFESQFVMKTHKNETKITL